jgi:cell division septation protein DedD
MLLLGMLAAVGYFLGFQKLLGGGKLEPRQSANARPPASTPASNPAERAGEAAKPADSTAKPPESSAPAGTTPVKEPEAAPASAPPALASNVQPTHSLQAASFPNEAGAKEFAEKLVRAGVPSYILAVDIPRRGRWFRVRVGQFGNAAEASKYALQARQRAKAGGINLDLMVCDYEKP